MKSYYTAKEAMEKLDLPKSTFHYLVRKGDIRKLTLPLRQQAVYPKQEIDQIAQERAAILAEIEATPDRLTFVVPNREDLEQLIEIEQAYYHKKTIIPVEVIQKRLTYSPENIHVLKDTKTNQVVGSITMSPIKPDVLKGLINLEMDETQIQVDDYLPFTLGEPLDCYVVSVIAAQNVAAKYYASRLLVAVVNYLVDLLERGIDIRRIYTVATTKEGEHLAQSLHLTSLKTDWQGQYEDFRHAYVLDLENLHNTSKLVKRFLQKKKNQERRKKRYQQLD
ncbi:MAG: helix-turn-helix domain-containing protein [Ktedonobacteraceae bacterium]